MGYAYKVETRLHGPSSSCQRLWGALILPRLARFAYDADKALDFLLDTDEGAVLHEDKARLICNDLSPEYVVSWKHRLSCVGCSRSLGILGSRNSEALVASCSEIGQVVSARCGALFEGGRQPS